MLVNDAIFYTDERIATQHGATPCLNDAVGQGNIVTNRWLIVLLHPDLGLQTFFLVRNELMQRWKMNQNDNNNVEDELLQWCGKQIESGKSRGGL